MTCFVCPYGLGPMCSGGCGLCDVCQGEPGIKETEQESEEDDEENK